MEGGLSFLCNISGAPSPLLSSSSNKSLSLNAPSKRRRIISEIQEIRVCTNRTCRRQGSLQTLETLSGLAPPNVAVKSCGCLGHCGAGPNLVALPGNGVVVGHCGTPARAAQVMVGLLLRGHDSDNTAAKTALEMLALKKRAQRELDDGNFSQAEALSLEPFGGIHVLYKDRSSARLALGNYSGALEDAREALTFAPQYHEAYICQGDAFLAMDQFDSAEKSYLTSLQIDPSIRRSKSFQARVAKLDEKLAAGNMP
ncbi:uncharacterized protein LOC133866935 isoform X2 [Alnus glutinosa]|uniref:uncharacterized protein LOC133866935 isoform X2 n=1 Tax=Alnus glutinosa TaxID=3517 RepID=UPI002D78DA61|nr:uncharacterized protein LOC133866935 isoform X2 [Alnus glutinosa]